MNTNAECKCDPRLTCAYCCRNAKPYFGFMAGPKQGAEAIEATCASCGDTCYVPGDEDPEDTLCAVCAGDEQEGEEDDYDLNVEGDPAFNGAW